MPKIRDFVASWAQRIERFVDKRIVGANKLRTLRGFEDVRAFLGVRSLDNLQLQRIFAMFQYLYEEYDPQILMTRDYTRVVKFESSSPDIEQATWELRSLRIMLEGKQMIPPYTRGNWDTDLSSYFIDDKNRYIPTSALKDFIAEYLRFVSVLMELKMNADDNAEYHLRQLGDLILLHTQFGLILKDNYEEFLLRQ